MNTKKKIIDGFKAILAPLGLLVIESGDNSAEINPEGTMAVEITNIEKTYPGSPLRDYKLSISFLGQTLIDYDPDKRIISEMFCQLQGLLDSLTPQIITENILENAVGFVPVNSALNSDSEVHNFTIDYELYICDLLFHS